MGDGLVPKFANESATVGQIFVIMTIAVAAAEVAVGISLVLNAYKERKTTDTTELAMMRW